MNHATVGYSRNLMVVAIASLLLSACSATATKPDGADRARDRLSQLQADPQLASRAPVAIKEAEAAVSAAEVPRENAELGQHLVTIADAKVDIASAQAQSRLMEDQRRTLTEQREVVRLDARTREADQAHMAARSARADTAVALQQTEELQQQIAELNARDTDRGLVVTLGDVLFATGKSDLKGGAVANLDKLAAFLNKYPDRTVAIEGHTDSVGSENLNLGLSQRRADSVKVFLMAQGIASSRLQTSGKGKSVPVADNSSATGRQQNRRVEVIISNTVAASPQ